MVKKYLLFAISVLAVIVLASLASATIMISQPKTVYSLGDEMSADITLDSVKAGYLDVNLICGNSSSINIYHNAPDLKAFSITRKLTSEYIGDSKGSCNLAAIYGIESQNGPLITINDEADITLTSESLKAKAGDNIEIKGTVYKKNSQPMGLSGDYPGFVEATIDDSGNLIQASGEVKDGQFSLNFKIPETVHAGSKFVNIKAYDKDSSGKTMNSGESTVQIAISQKPAKLSIAIDNSEISPGGKIIIVPSLIDFAGDAMESQILVKIANSEGKSIFEGFIPGNREYSQEIKTGDIPGEYKAIAQKDSLSAEKTFDVSELKKVNISLDGNVLTITNIGNVAYRDLVEVKIGGSKVLKQVNLEAGEKIQYEVSAPDGTYSLEVKGEKDSFFTEGVALTGNAVKLSDVRNKINNIWASYPVVWIFLVIILFIFVWAKYKRWQQTKRFTFLEPSKSLKKEVKKRGGVMVINPEEVDEEINRVVLNGPEVRRAEQVTVMHGQKTRSAVIAIKLKNDIEGIARNSFLAALQHAYKNGGVSYDSGDHVLLIFSPLVTKNQNNEPIAIKSAVDIDNALKEHNRKYRANPIIYGIGVNSGEMINKITGKILQFTSIGKTINMAKRVSDLSDSQVLLSSEARNKAGPNFRVEKFASGGMDLFAIKRVVNTEESAKFIDEFVRRNDFTNKQDYKDFTKK